MTHNFPELTTSRMGSESVNEDRSGFPASFAEQLSRQEPPLPDTAAEKLLKLPKRRGFLFGVLLPFLLACGYYLGVAADQYASETHFTIRSHDGNSAPISPFGELLGGTLRSNGDPGAMIRNYLLSLDALNELRDGFDVVAAWQRPMDPLTKLWWNRPPAELLLWYYRRMISVVHEPATGIISLEVRAFDPDDAHIIAERLVSQAESLVNRLSERARYDRLRMAQAEVEIAEQRVTAAREAITELRERQSALDPGREAAAGMETVARLESTLATVRTELQERLGFMHSDHVQIQALRNRIASLEREITDTRSRLTSGREAAPQRMATFERLSLEREFADRHLASAINSLESARLEANRQQIYLARITGPNRAEYPIYPRTSRNLLAIFLIMMALYGIIWLIKASVREHAHS